MRDVMIENNLDRIMYLDTDVMLYVQPDELFLKVIAFRPSLVLVSNSPNCVRLM